MEEWLYYSFEIINYNNVGIAVQEKEGREHLAVASLSAPFGFRGVLLD